MNVPKKLSKNLQRSHEELETAYEELQSTNEELETTNEELQSTIEELETTNEELQSTNEELETMNEELQSTNEELRSSNSELEVRTRELNDVNALLESIVGSFVDGVVVLDRKMAIQIWNGSSEELWGLRADEVSGQNFLSLDIGLPVEKLAATIRHVQDGEKMAGKIDLDAVNRRGKAIQVQVTLAPLKSPMGKVEGVVMLMKQAVPSQ
jgi:two-component system CheB/CheR fusion protein